MSGPRPARGASGPASATAGAAVPAAARPGPAGGLRERNKIDKLDRIRRAAFAVLEERGFEGTTIREIAARAGVGHGTVFSYTQDKVELCLMSVQEGLGRITEQSFACLDMTTPLVDQLVAFLRHRYVFWERHRALFFAATQKLSGDYADGAPSELDRAKARRAHTKGCVRELLHRAQARGEIQAEADLDNFSSIILDIYLQELRFWLNDDGVGLDEGLAHLRRLLTTLTRLIGPAA